MRICPSCKTENLDSALNCGTCGASLANVAYDTSAYPEIKVSTPVAKKASAVAEPLVTPTTPEAVHQNVTVTGFKILDPDKRFWNPLSEKHLALLDKVALTLLILGIIAGLVGAVITYINTKELNELASLTKYGGSGGAFPPVIAAMIVALASSFGSYVVYLVLRTIALIGRQVLALQENMTSVFTGSK